METSNKMILKILIVLSIVIGLSYIQIQHSKASYPNTFEAKLVLFISGFISGILLEVVFFYTIITMMESLVLSLFMGIFSGFLCTFAIPYRIKTLEQWKR